MVEITDDQLMDLAVSSEDEQENENPIVDMATTTFTHHTGMPILMLYII